MNNIDTYKKATNLQEVFENFDPDWEIPPDCPFVVTLPEDPLRCIRNKLTIALRNPVKIFFAGHRGAGKTLQIHKLINELIPHNEFLPFYLDVKKTFDPINLEYQDIIFGIVSTVYETYAGKPSKERLGLGYDRENNISSNLRKRFEKWGDETIKETKTEVGGEIGIDTSILSKFLPWFTAKLKASKDTATISRQVIEPKIDALLQIYADMVAEIEKEEGKKVFIVIDGMDKIDFKKSRDLLTIYLDKLMQPNSSLLYVVPIAVSYQMTLVDIEEKICRIDNTPIFSPIGQFEKLNPDCYDFCSKVIFNRMEKEKNLIDDSALKEIIRLSAGVTRLLISNMQKASEKAMARNSKIIEKEDVLKVKSDNTYFFRQVLTFSDDFKDQDKMKILQVCKEIRNNPQKQSMDKIIGPLIHNLMVIEYPNKPRLYGIHPAMERLLNDYLENK